jgi:hypothetical protein
VEALTGDPASSWITALTVHRGRNYRTSQPEGADRSEGPEIASRTSAPPPVASGASFPACEGRLTAAIQRGAPDGT